MPTANLTRWVVALQLVTLGACTPTVKCDCQCQQAALAPSTVGTRETVYGTTTHLPDNATRDDCVPMGTPPEKYRVEGAKDGPMKISRELDLDDNGVKDAWVTAPQFCNPRGECVYALYLQNEVTAADKCGSYVGVTWGSDFSIERFRQQGLHTFHAVNRLGWVGDGSAIVRYRFNGKEYVGSEQQICIAWGERGDECSKEAPLGDTPLPVEGWDQPYP